MDTPIETLVIDRTKWYRGHGSSGSALVRSADHLMCCLGFCALQRGFTKDELLEIGTPGEIVSVGRWQEDALWRVRGLVDTYDEGGIYETDVCDRLVDVNDDEDLSEPTRERRITELFAEIGVAVTFVN